VAQEQAIEGSRQTGRWHTAEEEVQRQIYIGAVTSMNRAQNYAAMLEVNLHVNKERVKI